VDDIGLSWPVFVAFTIGLSTAALFCMIGGSVFARTGNVQGGVSSGKNLFLPDMRFEPVQSGKTKWDDTKNSYSLQQLFII